MDIFNILLTNIFPLYGLIALGFILARMTEINMNTVASILIYVLVPVVMCGATWNMELHAAYALPPFMVALISAASSLTAYAVFTRLWPGDKRANMVALLNVSSNATYFGVPIAIAFAGADSLGLYMMMILPLFILDGTMGVYYAARGHFDVRQSLLRVAKIPIIYGAMLGLVLNVAGFEMQELLHTYWDRFTGALVIVGMMIIGVALAQIDRFRMDYKALLAVIATRYGIWLSIALLLIIADQNTVRLLDGTAQQFLILIVACPLAANNVAYAVKFDLHPALTATLVTITTLAALITMPLIFALTGILL